MEWIMEGVALIFVGVLVSLVTYVDPSNAVSKLVYSVAIIALISMAVVALLPDLNLSFCLSKCVRLY